MKKGLALFLAVLMCMSLAACVESGGGGGGGNNGGSVDIANIDANEVVDTVTELMDKVDSVRIREEIEMSINAGSRNMVMSGTAVAELSIPDGKAHITSQVSNMGMNVEAEMYVEQQGDDATVYMSMNGGSSWGSYTVPVSALANQEGYYSDLEEFKMYLTVLTNIERSSAKIMGKDAVLVKGEVDYNKLAQFLVDAGFASAISQGSAAFEQKIKELYSNLSPVEIMVYLDASSGLPLQIEMDPTAMFNSFYANAGTGMNFSLDYARMKITFEDYGNVQIDVPNSAKNSTGGMFGSAPESQDEEIDIATPDENETLMETPKNFGTDMPSREEIEAMMPSQEEIREKVDKMKENMNIDMRF